mgnify:CR=1 FL=1
MDSLPDDWTDEQHALFLRVFRFLSSNMDAVCHPKTPRLRPEHWQTICHNAAFVAAECVMAENLRIMDSNTNETIAESAPHIKH